MHSQHKHRSSSFVAEAESNTSLTPAATEDKEDAGFLTLQLRDLGLEKEADMSRGSCQSDRI